MPAVLLLPRSLAICIVLYGIFIEQRADFWVDSVGQNGDKWYKLGSIIYGTGTTGRRIFAFVLSLPTDGGSLTIPASCPKKSAGVAGGEGLSSRSADTDGNILFTA